MAQVFVATQPDQIWLSTITYIRTGQGWLYLAAILDLYARRIVGWAMGKRLQTDLTLKALEMALMTRRPNEGLSHHSDRGSQYTSKDYQALLSRHKALPSMRRAGNAYDNAPMGSFFATLKTELVHHCRFETREQAQAALFDYMEIFYNRQRSHSALGYRTPADFGPFTVPLNHLSTKRGSDHFPYPRESAKNSASSAYDSLPLPERNHP